MSLRGCLGVLVACLQDGDLEVIKKVIFIVDKLMVRLNKYNFVEVYNKSKKGTEEPAMPVKPVIDSNYSEFNNSLAGNKDPVVRNNADFSKTREVSISNENGEVTPDDSVIQSIVNSDDLSLLSNKYKANLNFGCEKVKLGQIDENLFKKFATVSPDEFLSFIAKVDMQTLVQDKSEWLQHSENFSSLLEDILQSFGHDIDLDCY